MKTKTVNCIIAARKEVHAAVFAGGRIDGNRKSFGSISYQMLDYSRDCKGCAMLLNDVLLRAEFSTRIVVLYSDDLSSPEAHLLVDVRCPSLNKWVAVDAAYDCCYYSSNGILGVRELIDEIRAKQRILVPFMETDAKHDLLQYLSSHINSILLFPLNVYSSEIGRSIHKAYFFPGKNHDNDENGIRNVINNNQKSGLDTVLIKDFSALWEQ